MDSPRHPRPSLPVAPPPPIPHVPVPPGPNANPASPAVRILRLRTRLPSLASSLLLAVVCLTPASAQQRTVTFTDLMKIRQIEQPTLSDDGGWIAFTAEPDRGDPEVIVRATIGDTRYVVPFGSHPVISSDGVWVAMRLNPSLEARETAGRGDAPKRGMVLLATATGEVMEMPEVQSFAFSEGGRYLAYHRFAAESEEDEDSEESEEGEESEAPKGDRKPGTMLVLRDLDSGTDTEIADVRDYTFDASGRYLAYSVASADNTRDGLYARDLRDGSEHTIHATAFGHYDGLTWADDSPDLAFVMATEDEDGEPGHGRVMAWSDSETAELASEADAPEGWFIPASSSLTWSDDAERLFFGWRPLRADELEAETDDAEAESTEEAEDAPFDPYDLQAILEDRGVDVWHWLDPQINPQQKVMWPRLKNRTFTAVHHMDSGTTVALGDPDLPQVRIPNNGSAALATTDVPYAVERTWMGGQSDAYVVDLETGEPTLFAERLRSQPNLSPEGRFTVYWADGHYHLYDVAAGTTRNLTADLGVPIANEDHDYPEPAPGYGVAGWLEGDAAVLINDKYDIWVIPTDGSRAYSLTDGAGRTAKRIFRIIDTDREVEAISRRGELLLSSYDDMDKGFGFYRARADRAGVTLLLEEDRRFRYRAQAEDADVVMFTREDYDEFPNLWVADTDFSGARQITDVNPIIDDFAWGTSELVEWRSLDGTPLQGVVIKPNDYDPDKRYPVLIYYYRFFSQRLHEFNDPSINHRPSFPIYASDGYVVFLPDVRFEVGRPGFSSTKSVVPGVQHLIDIGLADPDAIALHGHSWSGYQTAFMVTQTDIFTTAVTGAPVSNMTSAYSGIRLGSGLARQFQYEMSQSRLSGSLWEARDEYIDNSPVFFADRINTPMLILHGDEDDAVPWEQSIELYLALRRLGKETVFLQYNGEPHHPQTYANKLDWAMKMKEWIDHYLKGTPAPAWITEGVPYTGR